MTAAPPDNGLHPTADPLPVIFYQARETACDAGREECLGLAGSLAGRDARAPGFNPSRS